MTNPAGFVIHSALHMAREDAKCVMHLHTIAGQAVSAQEEGLLPACQASMIAMTGGVAYHDYEGIAVDMNERERLVGDMGSKYLMILRNHGVLAVGETIGDAFLRMYFMERACQVQIAALSGGSRLNPPPQGTPEKTAEQAEAFMPLVARHLAWPAVVRKMQRLYPDFDA
jgi:ribulose-5-phosphate 4-epimerase/fuculose-1-phosphate aldolase